MLVYITFFLKRLLITDTI
jgi:hypothetical protein